MPEEVAVAAAPPVETSATDIAEVDTGATETDATDTEVAEEPLAGEESPATEQPAEGTEEEPKPEELAEFSGSVGARLREMYKTAPGLQKLLEQFPKVRDTITAAFKRDAALREQNLTVAELKEYRERLPNGLQDLNTIEQELGELGKIDGAFYGKRGGELFAHMHQADPEAAVAFAKELPKHWARLDPDSYNDVFGSIIGATLRKDGKANMLYRAYQRAQAANDKEQMADIADVYNYLLGFGRSNEDDSPEAQKLRADREKFQREQQQRTQKDIEGFHGSFMRESERFQRDLIRKNQVFQKLPQAIPEAKRARMVDLIRNQIITHLNRSRAFMNQMEPAYSSMDVQKCLEVQKGAQGWQPWIVNMYVRRVLAEETPGLIEGNRAANDRKKAAAARGTLANRPARSQQTPAGDKNRKNPNDPNSYTMEEIMSGKVPESVLDAYLAQRGR